MWIKGGMSYQSISSWRGPTGYHTVLPVRQLVGSFARPRDTLCQPLEVGVLATDCPLPHLHGRNHLDSSGQASRQRVFWGWVLVVLSCVEYAVVSATFYVFWAWGSKAVSWSWSVIC